MCDDCECLHEIKSSTNIEYLTDHLDPRLDECTLLILYNCCGQISTVKLGIQPAVFEIEGGPGVI